MLRYEYKVIMNIDFIKIQRYKDVKIYKYEVENMSNKLSSNCDILLAQPIFCFLTHHFVKSGELTADDDILEWLIQNRNSGDEEDIIEEVEFKSLEAMVSAVENIAVLFCK